MRLKPSRKKENSNGWSAGDEAVYEWPNDFGAIALGRYQSIEPSHWCGGISECDCRQEVIGTDSVDGAFLAGRAPVSRGCLKWMRFSSGRTCNLIAVLAKSRLSASRIHMVGMDASRGQGQCPWHRVLDVSKGLSQRHCKEWCQIPSLYHQIYIRVMLNLIN